MPRTERICTLKRKSQFISTHMADKGFFGYSFGETNFLSLKLCRVACIILKDGRITDEYVDGVLTPLFDKSAHLTGTTHDVAQDREANQRYLNSMRYAPPQDVAPQETGIAPAPTTVPVAGASQAHDPAPAAALHGALGELEKLIGIPRVKDEVKKLAAFLSVQKERQKYGLPTPNQTLHFVFTGNPGTGKTTVARIVAKILFGFELLKTPKLVETDRANLVGGYLGQTAIKTDEVIKSALDGVLFIDEAYTLSAGHDQDSFGMEAISTILKRMEDYRSRLSVIVAGYPKLMDQFLGTNPGLASRFTRTINFDDYSVPELGRIFLEYCKEARYELDPSCLAVLSLVISSAYAERNEKFGNARFVRNLFEQVQLRHSQRVYANPNQIDKAALVRLAPSDFWDTPRAGPTLEAIKWRATCGKCQAVYTGNSTHFGRIITCRRCKSSFAFHCWDPVLK